MENLIIRDLTRNDAQSAAHLMKCLHTLHTAERPDIYCEADGSLFESRVAEIAGSRDYIALLAEHEEKPIGIVLVSLKDATNPLCNRRRIAFIEAIYVDEPYRRHGVGAALYKSAAERAKSLGSDAIELSVAAFNTEALMFYAGMGMTNKSTIMEIKI